MNQQFFDEVIEYPDAEAGNRYESLVGLDLIKERLFKESQILLNPESLEEWSKKVHGAVIPLAKVFKNRNSLFIFAGDVGTGKTTLAESFGNNLAMKNKINITLFKLSLNTRGGGAVGEMTRLISLAFQEVKEYASPFKKSKKAYCILFIDEADALAQSRELDQMHHEDRAGVNALIRGIDSITKDNLPILTVMSTNRLKAFDPAVRRRAAGIFEFNRPSEEQRLLLIQTHLNGTGISPEQMKELAVLMGEDDNRGFGYTYSDITQNVLPSLVLDAYPDQAITYEKFKETLQRTPPTPPFGERLSNE